MGEHLLPGNPPIAVDVRHSARARRLSLRISRRDGRVTLTLPRGMAVREGMAFAVEREEWLRRNLAEIRATLVEEVPLAFGGTVPFRGEAVRLVPGAVRGPVLREGELVLPALAEAVDRHAARLGRAYGRITLRDTKGRWGSCSVRGDLMFSWRLVMAPPSVLDYVAAHEVAHLAEMNHSQAFWAVVARLYPGYAAERAWLRAHGPGLHAVRFTG